MTLSRPDADPEQTATARQGFELSRCGISPRSRRAARMRSRITRRTRLPRTQPRTGRDHAWGVEASTLATVDIYNHTTSTAPMSGTARPRAPGGMACPRTRRLSRLHACRSRLRTTAKWLTSAGRRIPQLHKAPPPKPSHRRSGPAGGSVLMAQDSDRNSDQDQTGRTVKTDIRDPVGLRVSAN